MVRIQAAGALAIALLSLTACGKSEQKPPVAVSALGATSPAPPSVLAPANAARAPTHEYASREGDVFYYQDDDGSLVGARDLGRLPANQDFSGLLKKGDRAVQFDGRMFAAVTPGSDVVRVARNQPGEQILRMVENVPLSGSSVAAKALRDSLAGLLTYPSDRALSAQVEGVSKAASVVQTAGYEGYVPEGFQAEGATYPGLTGAQILGCADKGLTKEKLGLSKQATHEWFGLCAKANPIHASFVANNCSTNPTVAACQSAIAADAAVRKLDGFWQIVNAMAGRPDDYNLD